MKATEIVVASASLPLRDLDDQKQHDKILPMKVSVNDRNFPRQFVSINYQFGIVNDLL